MVIPSKTYLFHVEQLQIIIRVFSLFLFVFKQLIFFIILSNDFHNAAANTLILLVASQIDFYTNPINSVRLTVLLKIVKTGYLSALLINPPAY